MAIQTLTVQQIDRAGITPSLVTANEDGYYVPNDGRVFLQLQNTDSTEVTVTIETPGTVDGLAVTDRTVAIPATDGDKMIGPFPPGVYNDGAGRIKVTFSAVTALTIGGFRL